MASIPAGLSWYSRRVPSGRSTTRPASLSTFRCCETAGRLTGRSRASSPTGSGPRPVGELAGELPVTRPAVSQHLKVLKDAGLVIDRKVGTRRLYQVDPQALADLRAYFDSFWDQSLAAFRDAAEQEEKRDG